MSKSLSEMTLEELWELFPIILSEHKSCWRDWYEEEKQKITALLGGRDLRINHIGSTAINNIWAKPIVDILIEIPISISMADIKEKLVSGGYICMSEEGNRKSFNKGYTDQGFAERVFHLHLRYYGDNDELYFRDYMNNNLVLAGEYEKLKISLWKKYEHNRDAYTNAKSAFVEKYTRCAKMEYENRYETTSHVRRRNYFVEGLQGAGKTTLVQKLSDKLSDYKVFREGDFSPVELAWCAYVTEEQYNNVLKNYPSLSAEIKEKTVAEEDCRIICYTQILTDVPDFHKSLEKFEIYNGNLDKESFENVIFERFRKWNEEGQIFECSIFQNIIENQILYLMMTDDEILDFYKRLEKILTDKPYKIIYLDMDDIPGGIDIIRKERSDDKGNELWYPLMMKHVEESPYGKEHALRGLEGLLMHLERRKALEHRIVDEIFKENTIIVKSKNYILNDIVPLL